MVLRILPEKLAVTAKCDLNENPERAKEDLRHLREWLVKQPHLNVRNDDQWLFAFLRGCKFSLQKAKEKIENLHTIRTLSPEYFSNRDPFLPKIQELLDSGALYLVTNKEDYSGPRTICIDLRGLNYDTVTVDDLVKTCAMGADILMLEDDNFIVSGVTLLIDCKGLNINYLSQCTPTFFKKCVAIGVEAYPFRIKKIICINASAVLESCFQIVKLVLSNKLKERFLVYTESDYDNLYEHVPKSELPFEKGGECGHVRDMVASTKKRIENYREWFIEDEKYRSNETKRIGSPRTAVDLFGVEGSFRKLNID